MNIAISLLRDANIIAVWRLRTGTRHHIPQSCAPLRDHEGESAAHPLSKAISPVPAPTYAAHA
jgi:hypothetical protein